MGRVAQLVVIPIAHISNDVCIVLTLRIFIVLLLKYAALLGRAGDDCMRHLLLNHSIFTALENDCYLQVARLGGL